MYKVALLFLQGTEKCHWSPAGLTAPQGLLKGTHHD